VPSREIETVEKAEPALQKRVRSVRFGAGGGSPQSAKQERHQEEDSPLARLWTKNHGAHKHSIQNKHPGAPRRGNAPQAYMLQTLGFGISLQKNC
jgi:hypothetical protein